jgi:two-component system chemotaxis sensor kinase CheA
VVTDIEMPNMNGFELTRRIKSSNAYSHLPVIALTTLAGEEDIERRAPGGNQRLSNQAWIGKNLIRSIYGFLTSKAIATVTRCLARLHRICGAPATIATVDRKRR